MELDHHLRNVYELYRLQLLQQNHHQVQRTQNTVKHGDLVIGLAGFSLTKVPLTPALFISDCNAVKVRELNLQFEID